MSRRTDAVSRMEILILSTLSRAPMHGYDIKLELRYKHARWWAKADHGHLYATLARLERSGAIQPTAAGRRKVYALTPSGRERLVQALEQLGPAADATYFDIDLFLSGSFALDQARVIHLLEERRDAVAAQVAEAEALQGAMSRYVPASAHLIIEHRLVHLRNELAFTDKAIEAFRVQESWGAYLGSQPIDRFVEATSVPLEPEG